MTPEEFPKRRLKVRHTCTFKKSKNKPFLVLDGQVEKPHSSNKLLIGKEKFSQSRNLNEGVERMGAVIGPEMTKLIAQLPKSCQSEPPKASPYKTPPISPHYISPNTLRRPSSPSDTPPSGMRSPPTGGPVQSLGSMQPNSNSYVPAQEKTIWKI